MDVYVDEAQGEGRQCGTWPENWADNQRWFIKPAGDGFFYFQNKETGFVLDCYVDDVYNGDGRKVGAWPENGGDNQLWYLDASEDGWMSIRNKETDLALDVDMESEVGLAGLGKQLICWPYHGDQNQQWGWGKNVLIQNLASGLVLDCFVSEGGDGLGMQVGAWMPNFGENQMWKVRPCGFFKGCKGAFVIKNKDEGSMVLDEYVGSEYNGDGKLVGAYDRNDAENQQWILEPADEYGYYMFKNVASGQVLDVDMESSVGEGGDGKQVLTWPYNGGRNQMWTFVFTA